MRLWVRVITKTPKVLLKCLGSSIEFEINGAPTKLECYFNSDGTAIGLIGYEAEGAYVKSLLRFLVEKSKTASPGIMIISLTALLKDLATFKNRPFDLKDLWQRMMEGATDEVITGNPQVVSELKLISSAHILTFPSRVKRDHETGESCAKMVNNHFFFYGPSNLFLSRKGTKLVNHKNAFLLNVICLNSLLKNVDNEGRALYLLSKYLDGKIDFKIESNSKVVNSFSLELLVHWSI